MADPSGRDPEHLRHILQSAHDAPPSIEELEAQQRKPERKKREVYKRFEPEEYNKHVQYDMQFIYHNLGRHQGNYIGLPTESAQRYLEVLNKDPERLAEFVESTMKPIIAANAKVRAERIKRLKRLKDDGRETVKYLEEYRDYMLREGVTE